MILSQLTAHHVGCLTENIGQSAEQYKTLGFKNVSEVYSIADQKVKVCFIEIRDDFFLELVECSPEQKGLKKILNSGNPYYHVGYKVSDFEKAIAELQQHDYRLINRFNSEAFGGKQCAFLYSPEMHLIELIEA
jgi:hypothetical protein